MDKQTRGAIESATRRARRLLEEDFVFQLDGQFDIRRDAVADAPGAHLNPRQVFQRERIMAALGHKQAAGMSVADAVTDYVRDAAFTTLNRFVALKMLERRGLVQTCVSKGEESPGFKEFCLLAPGLPLLPESAGYRLYIESLFDELSTEVKVLFDRRDPASVLWPRRAAFEELLGIINDPGLDSVWGEDETIGWVYQYFNSTDERRQMRDESQAPRNSRELAIRNQFFTPRYVVQFLTDNTLGRIWYEMRGTKTTLTEKCEYMVRRPGETFAPRTKQDPRDLRILDPACGSGHFLLYAFDLLITIYEEAYADPAGPASEETGCRLTQDYADLAALRAALPGLVLRHNLHGVDIDPRCAQIARLALWLRAQRAFDDFQIDRTDRPAIRRTNVVLAEPLVADDDIAKGFSDRLSNKELADVFTELKNELALAGVLGVLLRIEKRRAALAPGYEEDLFPLDEASLQKALDNYAKDEATRTNTRRRMFADDATQGLDLLAVADKKYDAVLMNPPFGEFVGSTREFARANYPDGANDIYAAMVLRGRELLHPDGMLAAITSRSFLLGRDHRRYRRALLDGSGQALSLVLDLGSGVLEATVETVSYVLRSDSSTVSVADISPFSDKASTAVRLASDTEGWKVFKIEHFLGLPQAQLIYKMDIESSASIGDSSRSLAGKYGRITKGLSTPDNFRFLRLRWELDVDAPSRGWQLCAKGGDYGWFSGDLHLMVNRADSGREMAAAAASGDGNVARTRQSSAYYGRAAAMWSRRSQKGFSARRLRRDSCFLDKSGVIAPSGQGSEETLPAIILALATTKYQDLIRAQSRYGSYETGMVGLLPTPDSMIQSDSDWAAPARLIDEIEKHSEIAQLFAIPASPDFDAVDALRRCLDKIDADLGNLGFQVDPTVWQHEIARIRELRAFISSPDAWRSFVFGVAIGRYDRALLNGERNPPRPPGIFENIGVCAPAEVHTQSGQNFGPRGIVIDDDGASLDATNRILELVAEATSSGVLEESWLDNIGDTIRRWISTKFFDYHLRLYSKSQRRAPVYWQLATPSASYSVWLYIHACTRDTMFRVQNDFVALKLRHEERKLGELEQGAGENSTAAQRREIDQQRAFVAELRVFLDEVRLVAPLWDPDLDDGVIINFAPLWRLVPQHKPWQTEVKKTWDELCKGSYDWSHLAMRLWPERVVPKCRIDRSLAIAHGLEDVFWVETRQDGWTTRQQPTRPVDELIAERTSPAVAAALRGLLDAPVTTSGRDGRRRAGTGSTR